MPDLNEEILELKAKGKSLRQIAVALNMSHEAVRKRLKAVKDEDQGKSRASNASSVSVNPLSTQNTPSLRSSESVNPRQRPRRSPQRGEKKVPQGVFSENGDLLSTIREVLEARGIEIYHMESDAYEGYQMKHNGQIIRFYVQRKIGVGKGQEETE
ncbi:MAG: hypothetical protein HXY46_03345 [Syntrophaceae bacterium]|nr:hypothetical protein [Syntrophaceae bacterium]